MKLYKFRPLNNLERLIDIVIQERLYCAPFDKLNDPNEGIYLGTHHVPGWLIGGCGTTIVQAKSASGLRNYEQLSRVCSLSASFSDLRLWSHYADGHKGVAVEIDFTGYETDLYPVEYIAALPQHPDYTVLGSPFPEQILTKKTTHWAYESELRLLQAEPYYSIEGRVTAVLLGTRVDANIKAHLRKVIRESIPLHETFINHHKLEVETRFIDLIG